MPRISSRLIRLALEHNPMVVPLLRANRTLESAKAELHWITKELPRERWSDAIKRRSRLEPLQYILGTQPFGPLDILCERNVLIPRWETEEWVTKIADSINTATPQGVSILDACTGTGCIPLLLKSLIPSADLRAFDFSEDAIKLALRNKLKASLDVDFQKVNLFQFEANRIKGDIDIVTSNPPYIPIEDYYKPVALNGPELSVKMYEPRDALVGHLEFYKALINRVVMPLHAKGFVFELGYEDQVHATASLLPQGWSCGRYVDLANRLRCVVGWKNDSLVTYLKDLANGGFVEIGDSTENVSG